MLRKFSVENFKGFEKKITLDFSNPGNYEFNKECVREGIIDKCAIYGINGIGKSNLGLAIFDLVNHLTEKNKELNKYITGYINLDSSKTFAEFEYEFQFEKDIVVYRYKKAAFNVLTEESLSINGKEMIYYDFLNNKGSSFFVGSETLNLESNSSNSRVKYIMGTAVLEEDNDDNRLLLKFKDFVDRMLLFYSLRNNGFIGYKETGDKLEKIIIDANKVKDFENFLNSQGLQTELVAVETPEGKKLYFKHKKGLNYFFNECSTGTESLLLLYSWLITLGECSFVYIDEFDAFYHYDLSAQIIRELKKFTNTQIVVSTHNTDIMNNDLMRPDCYFVLSKDSIQSFHRSANKDLRFAHNLQKMYKANSFGK